MTLLRKSSYLISVKLDKEEKQMFVHGYTGAIDIVSKSVADYLADKTTFSDANIPFTKATLDTLIERGYITTKSQSEEFDYTKRFAALLHKNSKLHKSYMFLVSYDCNFRCPYCFESEVSHNGRQWSKVQFTKEMVDLAYKSMMEIEPNGKFRNKTITLYGGEPLLKENREIVEYIVNQGVKFGYIFNAITNGYDLNNYLDLLGPNKINAIQITIDGEKERHDQRRVHHITGSSFDKIIDNISLALPTGVNIAIRVNTDSSNFTDLHKLKAFFTEKGFFKLHTFSLHSALLIGEGNLNPIKNRFIPKQNTVPQLLSRINYNKLHLQMNDETIRYQDSGVYQKLYGAIKDKKNINLRAIFCSVQSGAYIFDPFGDIYNCWETVGEQKHILGNYTNGLIWYNELQNWHKRDIGTTPKCSKCKYGFLCGGGCLSKTLRAGGDFKSSYCDEYSHTFELMANKAYKATKIPLQ